MQILILANFQIRSLATRSKIPYKQQLGIGYNLMSRTIKMVELIYQKNGRISSGCPLPKYLILIMNRDGEIYKRMQSSFLMKSFRRLFYYAWEEC